MRNIYAILLFLAFSLTKAQNPADIDFTFNNKSNKAFLKMLAVGGISPKIKKSIVQPDGKILVFGQFEGYYIGSTSGEYVKCRNIVRLNSDQTIDPTFNFGFGFTGNINTIGIQSNGKIIIAIETGTANRAQMVRLNSDGTTDNTFTTVNGVVSFTVLGNDKILYVYNDGFSYCTNMRLNSDGTPDNTFTSRQVSCTSVKYLSDGTMFSSDYTTNYGSGHILKKYDQNGVEDLSFNSNTSAVPFYNGVNVVEKQPDGKILVGGNFGYFGGTYRPQLVRLNADGTFDTTFTSLGFSYNSTENITASRKFCVNAIVCQPDGKILVGGYFPSYGTEQIKSLIRVNNDGTVDPSFTIGSGITAAVSSLNLQSNGNVFVGLARMDNANGDYTTISPTVMCNGYQVDMFFKLDTNGNLLNEEKNADFSVKKIVKNSNGQLQLLGESRLPYHRGVKLMNGNGSQLINSALFSGFNSTLEVGTLYSTSNGVVQSNGKIVIGGYFTQYNGVTANGLIRLNSDYTRDTSFNIGTGFTKNSGSANVLSVALQADGKILVSGYYDFFNGIAVSSSVVRINTDGSLDTSFFYNQRQPQKMIVLSNGKILIGKERLNSDGTLDSAFVWNNNSESCFALQSDGKIIMANASNNGVRRLNADGSVDASFIPYYFNGSTIIKDIVIQADDKILIATRDISPTSPGGLARLNSNGTVDAVFNTGAGFNSTVDAILIESDGKILVGGGFTRYNGLWCNGLVRLLGGDAYLIKGDNKFDFNNNGCDASDVNFPNMKFNLVSGAANVTFIANNTGNYFIPVPSGTHTLTPYFENPGYLSIAPTSVTVNFPSQASPFVQDFCITPNGVHPDIEVVLVPVGAARPGFDAAYKLIYKNKGNQLQSGTVNLTFNDAVLDFVSATPAASTSATNVRTWNYTNLYPFETREITLKFNLNSSAETPPLNSGDVLNYTTAISSAQIDDTPNDNTFVLNQSVVNSYDPNDKTCLEGLNVGLNKVGDYVHYVIRFENSGTYAAQNITVRDVIDTNKFDISTLVPLRGSHSFTTKISETNKVEFMFENINLPFTAGTNTGYVTFKIKTKSTLVVGNSFGGFAGIYFDYNPAITTNTYTTTIQALGNQDFSFVNYFSLYPNPVSDVLNINKKEDIEISSIHIYNVIGQLMMVIPNAKNTTTIDVSNLASGNYFVKINSDKGTSNTKFIKR